MRTIYMVTLVVALAIMQLAYINCSRNVRFDSPLTKMASSDGGGDGYSGKLYVIVNPSGLCADNNPYLAQIEVLGNQASLQRENCASVAPTPVDVVISSVDSNYLAYGQDVFREDSSLQSVLQAPTVLAAMGMESSTATNHVCAGEDCWKFEGNGSLSRTVQFATAGDFDFTVLARADLASGVGANFELRIDGVAVASATVGTGTDAEYKLRATVAAGQHAIEIAYVNDYQDPPNNIDRNLYVVSVRIESVGVTTSLCLSRVSGSLLTLQSAQLPYANKALSPETRVDTSAVNYSGTVATPLKLGGGANSCVAGGSFAGAWSLTDSSAESTFGIGIYGPNFLVENYRVDNYGNCIGIWDNASGFNVKGAYCTQIRGDFISNKNSWGGSIEDSLFDGGISFFNDTGLAGAPAGAVTTIRDNLVRLQRFQTTYWGTPGHGWFWRHDSASPVKLRLHGNVFMAEEASLSSMALDPSTILSCKKADGSPDNTIVWLGAGAYPRPAELDTGCFTLTTDRAVWDQAVADWKSSHGY